MVPLFHVISTTSNAEYDVTSTTSSYRSVLDGHVFDDNDKPTRTTGNVDSFDDGRLELFEDPRPEYKKCEMSLIFEDVQTRLVEVTRRQRLLFPRLSLPMT